MIEVNNKFNIGEEVYSIRTEPIANTCDLCKGNGFIVYEEKELRCPQCKGTKVIINDKFKMWKVIPEKLKVSSMRVNINETTCSIRYNLSGIKRAEQNLFNTFEEAQKRCDELNFVLSNSTI